MHSVGRLQRWAGGATEFKVRLLLFEFSFGVWCGRKSRAWAVQFQKESDDFVNKIIMWRYKAVSNDKTQCVNRCFIKVEEGK